MNQPAQREKMRDAMPETAAFVDRKRGEWGAEHVNHCLRQAQAGVPGYFYAIEGGKVLGTPFPEGSDIADWQARAVLWGLKFAAFIAPPEAKHGAH